LARAGRDPKVVNAADRLGVVGTGWDVHEGRVPGTVEAGDDAVEPGEEGRHLGPGHNVAWGVRRWARASRNTQLVDAAGRLLRLRLRLFAWVLVGGGGESTCKRGSVRVPPGGSRWDRG